MSSYRGLHARSNGVENVSNGGSVRSNWQWCGMGKGQRLKNSKFKVEREERPETHYSKPKAGHPPPEVPLGWQRSFQCGNQLLFCFNKCAKSGGRFCLE
jgi:hypothetical protein